MMTHVAKIIKREINYREMPKKRQFNAEDRDPRKLKLVCVGWS